MLLDLVDKLVDRCIGLLNAHKQHKQELFLGYIEPVFAQLEELHQFYLRSFDGYRRSLEDPATDLNAIHGTICRDNIFSEHLRAKLRALAPDEINDSFRTFLSLIHSYLVDRGFSDPLPLPFAQRWEATFLLSVGIATEFASRQRDPNEQYVDRSLDPNEHRKFLKSFGMSDPEIEVAVAQRIKREAGKVHPRTWGELLDSVEVDKETMRSEALQVLDTVVMQMQRAYSCIVTEYAKLRSEAFL